MPAKLDLPQRPVVDANGNPVAWFARLLQDTIETNAYLSNLAGDLGDIDGSLDDIADGAAKVGLLVSERTKLSGVEDGATADQTDAEILAAWESESGLDDAALAILDGTRPFTGQISAPSAALNFVELSSYTVGTAPAAGTAGRVIFVSNGDAGSPCLAVDDGADWLVISLGAAISAT